MPSRPAVILAAAAAIISGLGPSLLPAGTTIDSPRAEDGFLEIGPFHLRPRLAVRDVGYDSNIFLSQENRVGDATLTLAPSLEAVTVFGHRGRLDLSQAVDLVGFLQTSSQNHLDSRSTGAWTVLFGDFAYSGGLGYSTEKLRPSEEIDERVRQAREYLHGRISWSPQERTEFSLAARRERMSFSNGAGPFAGQVADLDRDETSFTAESRFRLRPKTDAVMEAGRTTIIHRNPALGRDAVLDRLIPGLVFDSSALIQGEVHLGWLRFQPEQAGRRGYDGSGGHVLLSARLGRRLRLQPAYQRDLAFSIFGNNLFFVRETVGLTATTALTQRFRLEAGVDRSSLRYPEPVSLSSFSGERQDRIHRYWAGWSHAPAGQPRYGLRVEWRNRDSNFDLADDRQVRIIGEAAYAF